MKHHVKVPGVTQGMHIIERVAMVEEESETKIMELAVHCAVCYCTYRLTSFRGSGKRAGVA